MKKLVSLFLMVCFVQMWSLPAFALSEKDNNVKKEYKHKVKYNKKTDDIKLKYEYVNLEFWRSFNDENLDNYINLAIEHNYDLKMASLTVKEYLQNTRLQMAMELPSAAIGFSPAYYNLPLGAMSQKDSAMSFPAILNYEADIFLKNHDKTKAVKKLYEISKIEERAAYIAIASAVGSTYLNVSALNDVIKYQEEIVKSREDIYNMMLASNKEGIVSTSDTVKAQKAYVYGSADLIELQKNRIKLLNQLAVLIGENPENINNLKISEFKDINFTKELPSELSTEIITNRPDYLKSEKLIEKAGIDVRVAKKEFLPTINLTGLAVLDGKHGSMFSNSSALWALAGGVMLPLFTGGSKIANLKLKKIQYDKMLENYYKTNLTAIQEVNNALASVKYDRDKLAEHTKQYNLEVKDFAYSQHKYNEGVISRLDLVQTKENLLNMEKLIASSRSECLNSYIGLYKAVGSKL